IFSKFLAEDLQQLVLDLYLQPQYAQTAEEVDLDKEWQQVFEELKRLSTKEQITQIAQELDELDGKTTKTDQEEQLQADLLEKVNVVVSRSKLK
ncbi:hypothetical protein KJ707_01665, partial [Patescibacteria group bacterium]|nr:hypothetical protein [Patescibacteria group bacterium]